MFVFSGEWCIWLQLPPRPDADRGESEATTDVLWLLRGLAANGFDGTNVTIIYALVLIHLCNKENGVDLLKATLLRGFF